MNDFVEKSERPYDCLVEKIDEILEGNIVVINLEDTLDLIEELNPKVELQLSEEKEKERRLKACLSIYHENCTDLAASAKSMIQINCLLKNLVWPSKVQLRADLIGEQSGYYFVVQYEESWKTGEEMKELFLLKKINEVVNLMCIVIKTEV